MVSKLRALRHGHAMEESDHMRIDNLLLVLENRCKLMPHITPLDSARYYEVCSGFTDIPRGLTYPPSNICLLGWVNLYRK